MAEHRVSTQRLENVLKLANRNITFTYLERLYGLSRNLDFSGVPSPRIVKDNIRMLEAFTEEIEPDDDRPIAMQVRTYTEMLGVLYNIPREDLIRHARLLGGMVLLGRVYDEHFEALHSDDMAKIEEIRRVMNSHARILKEETRRIGIAWQRRNYDECYTGSPTECVLAAEEFLDVVGAE